MAIGEVKAKQDVAVHRSLALRELEPEGPLWGIFAHPGQPDASGWKLPTQAAAPAATDYEPNEELLETLYETFAQTNEELKKLEAMEATTDMQREEIVGALLRALPAPINEQIRKLLLPSSPGANEGYDKVGLMRLTQIAQTYQITMDFLVFTLLAQIWDLSRQPGWRPSSQLQQAIMEFFNLSAEERQNLDYFTFIRVLRGAFPEAAPSLFVKELDGLRQAFLQREDIEDACFFLETLRRQLETVGAIELSELCSRAEDALATVFS